MNQHLSDEELLRYSRQILLAQVDIDGQLKLKNSRVLIVGLGGLGSPVALYLGSAGVGHITVVDHDTVDLTNLQRQIAHTVSRLGQPKVVSIQSAIASLNPGIEVTGIQGRADASRLNALVSQADVVLDCCDNFATRQAINAACVRHRTPLVSGAAIRFDGQISVFDARDPQSPCYACVFPAVANFEETRCATLGVFAPLVGIIGSMQAAEALKLITGAGHTLTGRLLMLDGRAMQFTEMRIGRDAACQVCGQSAELKSA